MPPQSAGIFNYQCWGYDSVGNRTNEIEQNTACPTPPLTNGESTHWAQYNTSISTKNQITSSDMGIPTYDVAGNVIQDALNNYVYDVEGRLCAVQNLVSGAATQYVYDADGRRVAKMNIVSTFPAAGSVCSTPSGSNFSLASTYIRGTQGSQDTELRSDNSWRTNVLGDGGAIATYSQSSVAGTVPALAFNFYDWEGTKRLQTTATGQISLYWSSDPFGAYLHSTGSATDATENHFTGQERDTEAGNDYFNARYYASGQGRFMNPDPSLLDFADQTNPQSFNLYSYALNNPLIYTDPTGLYCDYSDHNDPDSGYDPTQFDFHSNNKECKKNGGQWVDDEYTRHGKDVDGRPEQAVPSITTPPAPGDDPQFDIYVAMDQQWLAMREPLDPSLALALGVMNFGIPKLCAIGLTIDIGQISINVSASGKGQGVSINNKKLLGVTTPQNKGTGKTTVPIGGPNGFVPFSAHHDSKGPLDGITSVSAGGKVKKVGLTPYANIGSYTPNLSDAQNCP